MTMAVGEYDILLAVDVQNDFCPGGRLAVEGGNEVVGPINRLGRLFEHVAMTQDWHPPGHISFASSHPGRRPFDFTRLDYGEQQLWPDHCVQATAGAEFHAGIDLPRCELVIRKGFHPTIDSYSAFVENDRRTPTGLTGYLHERGFRRVFVAGLALDYCVHYSAVDAARNGFETFVIGDACRAINSGDPLAAAMTAMLDAGVSILRSEELL